MKLELRNLSFKFKENIILNAINQNFLPGNHVIVGKNGVGKSTLLKVISGILTPSGGEVSFHHENGKLSKSAYRNQIILAESNQRGFYPRLSGIDNLRFISCLKQQLISHHEAEKILLEMGFSQEDAKNRFQSYSQGMRQKMQLAKLSLKPCSLMILDEPSNYLDLKAQDELIDFLNSKSNDKIKILVSHDVSFINKLNAKIFKMENRSLVEIHQ